MKLKYLLLEHKYKILVGIILIVCLIAGGIYSINSSKQAPTGKTNTKSTANTPNDLSSADPQSTTVVATEKIVKPLPNGKTITYPNDEKNKNIVWTVENEEKTEHLLLSHRAIETFVTTVDPSIIAKVCGTEADAKALLTSTSVGILNTSTRQLAHPQNASCLDLLASSENTDENSRTKAEQLVRTINKDVEHFTNTIVVN